MYVNLFIGILIILLGLIYYKLVELLEERDINVK